LEYKLHSVAQDDVQWVVDGKKLPVMEEFYTIQGEGFNTGIPSYFIRLGGCDVGCHWCDVKESWNANLHPLVITDEVITHAESSGCGAVVVTGGEPLLYNLEYLTRELQQRNIKTFMETSGAYPFSGKWDWVCLSPKKTMEPLPESYQYANELKVIVYNKNDFKWAEEKAQKVNNDCHLFLQPEWSKREELLPLIIDYVKKNTRWRISLQTHKYIHIP